MASVVAPRRPIPKAIKRVDDVFRAAVAWVTCTLLVLMVLFTVYTVVMRYVFRDPPFWGDTVALFCNIWLVVMAYSLAVREREDISTEGLYIYFSPRVVFAFRFAWQVMTLVFGIFLFWYGLDAALNVPGQFWELGGLPKKIPMMILPLGGVFITLVTMVNLAEDTFGWRSTPDG